MRRLKEAPSEKALTGAIRASCLPDQAALRDVLRKYILEAADAGGQDALDRARPVILEALKKSGLDVRAQEAITPPLLPPSSASPLWRAIEDEWFKAGGPGEVRKGAIPLHEDMKSTVQELLSRGEGWNADAEGFVFHLRDPALQRELLRRGEKIKGRVTDTMLSDFRDLMSQQFYREGLPPDQLALEIEELFPTTYKDRALTIVETETGIAYGVTNHEAMLYNGVDGHEWMAAGPDPRDAHRAASGQVRPINEPFIVGGERLMHPGDPSGSPGNIIRCHCDELPVIKDPQYIPATPWRGEPIGEFVRDLVAKLKPPPHFETPGELAQHLSARYPDIEFDFRGMDPELLDEVGQEVRRMLDAYGSDMLLQSITVGTKLWNRKPYANISEIGDLLLLKDWWGDAKAFRADLEKARQRNYFSPGGCTPRACITHELGHAVDLKRTSRKNLHLLREWHERARETWDEREMGQYGLQSSWEPFAEAWVTMHNVPRSQWPQIVVELHRRLQELGIVR